MPPKKPSLPRDFLYRIDGPEAMASIREDGFKAYTKTGLGSVNGIPKESFDAQKDGWEIPPLELIHKPRCGFFSSIEAASRAPGFNDRTLCRYTRTHPEVGNDSLIFVDGCMQQGTVLYCIFPNAKDGDVVITQDFIEYFDTSCHKWLPLRK